MNNNQLSLAEIIGPILSRTYSKKESRSLGTNDLDQRFQAIREALRILTESLPATIPPSKEERSGVVASTGPTTLRSLLSLILNETESGLAARDSWSVHLDNCALSPQLTFNSGSITMNCLDCGGLWEFALIVAPDAPLTISIFQKQDTTGSVTKHPVGSQSSPSIEHQAEPVRNSNAVIQDLVIKDIERRKQMGLKRYGTYLQPFNGRDALVDAYQEAIDMVQYLRQEIEERKT